MNYNVEELLKKYRDNTCTPEELALVENYFSRHVLNNDRMPDAEAQAKALEEMHMAIEANFKRTDRRLSRNIALLIGTAATLLLAFTISLYFYKIKHSESVPALVQNDIPPGGNRAILTLADGSTIDLDSAANGLLAQQQDINISKSEDGIITYEMRSDDVMGPATATGFNTVSTPRGGQYRVILPDGSTVWLNAASSLRYPTAFNANERKVELTGEGYFEVARDEKQPFIVHSGRQSVQVLGTEFNINAYENEITTTTTLVSGSIAINNTESKEKDILKPGQQAVWRNGRYRITAVDVNPYTAWKNGEFLFTATPLDAVLRQVERWYDIEVDYSSIPDRKLHAAIRRDIKLSTLLYSIEKVSGLKFQLKERRLTLLKE